jgi:hypothetical protein
VWWTANQDQTSWSSLRSPLSDQLRTPPARKPAHALAAADHDEAYLAVASIAVALIVTLNAPAPRQDVENARPAPLTT